MPDITATPALTRRRLLQGIGGSVALGALWPYPARAGRFVSLRDRQADKILNEALAGDQWWKGASIDRFDRKQYDEIRLRRLSDGGYLAYVSGEGGENFTHEQVVRTVWDHQDKLDNHFESTVTAINLLDELLELIRLHPVVHLRRRSYWDCVHRVWPVVARKCSRPCRRCSSTGRSRYSRIASPTAAQRWHIR